MAANRSEWKFLESIYGLLVDENVLDSRADQPVVTFKFPDELKVSIAGGLRGDCGTPWSFRISIAIITIVSSGPDISH